MAAEPNAKEATLPLCRRPLARVVKTRDLVEASRGLPLVAKAG